MKRADIAAAIAVTAALLAVVPGSARAAEGVRLKLAGDLMSDSKNAALKAPEGVALTKTGVVVADTGNGRLVVYGFDADNTTPRAEFVVPELPYPQRVAASSKGELFVLDGRLRRVGKLSPRGQFQGYVELPGKEPAPVAVRVDRNDRLWVVDIATDRLIVVDPNGKVTKELQLPRRPGAYWSDVAVDARGNAFVIDAVGRQVFRIKTNTIEAEPFGPSLRDELDFGTALAVDDAGRVFVADQNGFGIVILGADGTFRGRQSGPGWKEGQLRYPSALDSDGRRLFVADRGNARVQVFTIAQ